LDPIMCALNICTMSVYDY